jgi:hypothetical protein
MIGFPTGQNLTAEFANASNSQKQALVAQRYWAAADVESSVTLRAQASIRTMAILKPFLMLASVAFVTGFAGYLAVARLTTWPASTPSDYQQAQSLPTLEAVDWEAGQRI